MKKLFFIVLLFVSNFIFAQENLKIGFSFSKYGQNLINNQQGTYGGPSYDSDRFINFGVQIINPINKWLDLESGLSFAKHYVIVESNLPPDVPEIITKTNFSLLEIPIQLKANFLKDYLFLKSGTLLVINVKENEHHDDFTGLGFELGAGANYPFEFGDIYLNPYFKVHNVIPFTEDNTKQNLLETGFKVGILFNL